MLLFRIFNVSLTKMKSTVFCGGFSTFGNVTIKKRRNSLSHY